MRRNQVSQSIGEHSTHCPNELVYLYRKYMHTQLRIWIRYFISMLFMSSFNKIVYKSEIVNENKKKNG